MVIQWTLCIFLVIYSLQNTFAYKVALKTEQNVFEKLFENMDREQLRIIFLSENPNGDAGQNHELHNIKPYAFMGHGSSYFFRNARKNKDDNISSHVYSFIKNRPYFKTIHYDDKIYKKSNVEDLSNCGQSKYDDEENLKTEEMTEENTKPLRSSKGKRVSRFSKYLFFSVFRTEKKL